MAHSALYHNLFGNKKVGNSNKISFQDIIILHLLQTVQLHLMMRVYTL